MRFLCGIQSHPLFLTICLWSTQLYYVFLFPDKESLEISKEEYFRLSEKIGLPEKDSKPKLLQQLSQNEVEADSDGIPPWEVSPQHT